MNASTNWSTRESDYASIYESPSERSERIDISLPHDLFRFHLTTSIMSYGNNYGNNNYIHVINIHNDGDDGKIAIGNLQ